MRRARDAYYTPKAIPQTIVPMLGINAWEAVLEPSCGSGVWADAAADAAGAVYVGDINPDAGAFEQFVVAFVGDYVTQPPVVADWIIGNPPYSEAFEHVKKAVADARYGVAMLLRLDFLGSKKRSKWLRENPPSRLLVLSQRPSFTGDGKTDGCNYAVIVWGGQKKGIEFVDWH